MKHEDDDKYLKLSDNIEQKKSVMRIKLEMRVCVCISKLNELILIFRI